MKLLFIHSDRIWYKVTKKTQVAEKITQGMEEGKMTDCLAVFLCVEWVDELKVNDSITMAKEDIVKTMRSVKANRIMLFPFAHLSRSLSKPEIASDIFKAIEKMLRDEGFEVMRVPFGWNKKFEVRSKGHPMAVLSRTICPVMDECKCVCPYCSMPLE
ncbi:MAG: hypothetical protein A7316_04240 [Candidatus Altiarchaeales archaeon WOR_SM1_86-2]|nr:MAG: hypothetical protein A7316_04240 [Candidatus Altiarchaeales archaeon WOR_SM1_86-2]ODS38219.1 MAG: hypothetical protein A7315_12735 [Candidatus Altiarchaeales archaeon WOR_SM1_79]